MKHAAVLALLAALVAPAAALDDETYTIKAYVSGMS